MTSQNSWDLGRFLKTLSYYGAVPVLSSFDWFQQWFGSRPTVDSREVIGAAGESASESAGESTGEPGAEPAVWVTGEPDLARSVAERLEAAGYRVLSSPNLELDQLRAMRAICCCGATVDRTGLERLQASGFGVVHRSIFDFGQSQANLNEIWGALDDVVMGGVSQSGIRFGDGVATFSGNVSTANSGGFASVRTRNLEPVLDLSAYEGVELRVRGDGQRYKFMLRTETRWDGVAYCKSFDTLPDQPPDQWQTVRIPFADLIAVFRARTVADSPIDTRQVTAWQLMLSKFEYDGALNPHFRPGQFQLQIASIGVYRPSPSSSGPRLIWIDPSPEAEQFLKTSGISYKILSRSDDVVAALG